MFVSEEYNWAPSFRPNRFETGAGEGGVNCILLMDLKGNFKDTLEQLNDWVDCTDSMLVIAWIYGSIQWLDAKLNQFPGKKCIVNDNQRERHT